MKPFNRRVFPVLSVLFFILAAGSAAADPGNKIAPGLQAKFDGVSKNHRERVIVSLDASVPAGLSRAQAIAAAQGRVIGAFKTTNNGNGLGVLARYQTLFGFSAELTRGQANALAKRGDVKFIEPMPVHKKMYNESHPLTDVDMAQVSGYDGSGAVIAIIDDGIDLGHAAFSGKYLGGYDFADNDPDPTIDCLAQSHGTAVAGVALGNGGGALGVAPGAEFVFLKIQGSGICGSASLDGDIVGAIDWATANQATYGIDIISMSLGGGLYSSESSCDGSSNIYRNAVENAAAAGITVMAASGNDGMCDNISRPACFSSVISVGATFDETNGETWGWCVNGNSCATTQPHQACGGGTRAAFQDVIADDVIVYSNSASFLDITAPSTCATSAATGGGTVDCFGGTSSSTPFAAGTAALAVEAAGKGVLTPADMLAVLSDSGEIVVDPKNGRSTPRVNGQATVDEAATYGGGPTNQDPNASFSYSCNELACDFTDNSSDSDGTIASHAWTFGDGGSASAANPSHSYGSDGSYTVTLTVTDDDGATDSTSQAVTVAENPPANEDPTASFSYSCSDLDCDFTDTSSDSDGSIASRAWTFGDGGSSSAANPSHSYGSDGSYTVTLTVTDDDGATDSTSQTVTVSEPASGPDLVASAVNNGKTWMAVVTDANGGNLQGTWSVGGGSCSGNQCSVGGLAKNVKSVDFTASTGETITVNR